MVIASALLLVWSWMFRYIHIALDTIVLYGVLRARSIDERADDARTNSYGLSEQPVSGRGLRGGSGGSSSSSKPVVSGPPVI